MHDFLDRLQPGFAPAQRALLENFLETVRTQPDGSDPETLVQLLAGVGELLELPNLDPREPAGYNTLIRTLLANVAGLYGEIDTLESAQEGLIRLNALELDRIEAGLREIVKTLETIQAAQTSNRQYTDVFHETFDNDQSRETADEWYRPLPRLERENRVESFVPLRVDPEDRSLKLPIGGDFRRTTNPAGSPIATVRLDELLGRSSDRRHPLREAVDGRLDSYWQEIILADQPLQADPLQVPWLPSTYTGGAACRIHFRWPFAIPFTELVVKPFARFPLRVLQLIWSNREAAGYNYVSNPTFRSNGTAWSTSGSIGNVVTYPTAGGYADRPYARITAVSGQQFLAAGTFALSGTIVPHHLHFKCYRTPDIQMRAVVEWQNSAGGILRADATYPELEPHEWTEWSALLTPPSGAVTGSRVRLLLTSQGSGTALFSDVVFTPVTGRLNLNQQHALEEDSLVVPINNAVATDLWVVLGQPHYEYVSQTTAVADHEQTAWWDWLVTPPEPAALRKPRPDGWFPVEPIQPLTDRSPGQPVLHETLTGSQRILEVASRLLRLLTPDRTMRRRNRYLYQLGAWELIVRHREYSPQGLWVSRPYRPRGECRELRLATTPPLNELGSTVRFWLTSRADDRLERAQRFTGHATFSAAGETPALTGATHFVLPVVTQRDEFDGSDRNYRVVLSETPYVNRERIATIHTTLTSGAIARAQPYNPNRSQYYLDVNGEVLNVGGYQPLGVTLRFPDGLLATPDLLGPLQPGDIGYSGAELLETAELTEADEREREEQGSVDERANPDDPMNPQGRRERRRERRRGRLVNRPSIQKLLERAQRPLEERLAELGLQADDQLALSRRARIRRRKKTTTVLALQTRHTRIVNGPNGVALSLYWHRSGADVPASGGIQTATDVLVDPNRYTVEPRTGIITVRDRAPSGNTEYDSFVAYYYYHRGENEARASREARATAALPTSGVDLLGPAGQRYPVTRNMTDYLYGTRPQLRTAQLDDLAEDYYPVFEYYVDDWGRLQFADNLFPYVDTPVRITVAYETLAIAPRLLIEYPRRGVAAFSTKTPVLHDFTLYANARR